jgi:hypothetical protein
VWPRFGMAEPPDDHAVYGDNKIEGGGCCQQRGRAGQPETDRAADGIAVVFRASGGVALRRPSSVCQRVDDVAGDECTQAVRGSPVLAHDLTLDHIER